MTVYSLPGNSVSGFQSLYGNVTLNSNLAFTFTGGYEAVGYHPSPAPVPGEVISFSVWSPAAGVSIAPLVQDSSYNYHIGSSVTLAVGWNTVSYTVPAGITVTTVGFQANAYTGTLLLNNVGWSNPADVITVNTPPVTTATAGQPVSTQVPATDSASGEALTFTATGLPAGLSISSSGLISGTPTAAGSGSVKVTAADPTGATGSVTFTFTVSAPQANTVTVSNPGTQELTVGVPWSVQLTATDSAQGQAVTWNGANLPAGFSMSSNGTVAGTPTASTPSPASVTITATDSTGAHGSATFSLVVSSPFASGKIYGVLGGPSGNLAAKQALKTAGVNAYMIQAQWAALQPDGPGTALASSAIEALVTEYDQCVSAGLYPFFEIALQYAPAWILPGGSSAIETFQDQAGNVFDGATAPSGQQVSNWQWTAQGRTYVSEFIAALGSALSAVSPDTYAVKIGGGYYGELHYPPSAISGGYSAWGYGASMQSGTGLSPDQAACPLPGYAVGSGTAAQDTQWWNWYLNGMGNWLTWFIAQMRSAGWHCPYYVCHPGYGVRSNQGVQSAGYQQAAGEGEDPVRMIGFYAADPLVQPYCTWLDAGADGFDPPSADSDLAAWKKVFNAAVAAGKAANLLGENTGGESSAQMDAIFSGAATGSPLSTAPWTLQAAAGSYQGIMWENYASLTGGGGSQATLAEYTADITGQPAGGGGTNPPPSGGNVTVDFRTPTQAIDPLGAGVVITEFGGNPVPLVGNAAWKQTMASLAPGHCRCSVAYYNGNPGYGAGGSSRTPGSATALINAIKSIGATPLVSYNGDSSDNGGLTAANAAALVRYFNDNGGQNGGPVKYWSVGNEPEVSGPTPGYSSIIPAMAAAASGVVIGAPAAAYWDTSLLRSVTGISGLGGLSYHAYDGADAAGSDNGGGGFYETSQYFSQTGTLRGYQAGLLYGVEEFNWNSAPPASETVTWQETMWIADVLGQILSSGAHGTVYGDSNGPLSVISDGAGGQPPFGTPMPAYWGIGIWTGMNGKFKRWSANAVSAVTTFPNTQISAYACDNGKIVLVNKDTAAHSVTIAMGGKTSGTYNVWATQGNPPSGITEVVTGAAYSGSEITYTVPAQTAVSIDVS